MIIVSGFLPKTKNSEVVSFVGEGKATSFKRLKCSSSGRNLNCGILRLKSKGLVREITNKLNGKLFKGKRIRVNSVYTKGELLNSKLSIEVEKIHAGIYYKDGRSSIIHKYDVFQNVDVGNQDFEPFSSLEDILTKELRFNLQENKIEFGMRGKLKFSFNFGSVFERIKVFWGEKKLNLIIHFVHPPKIFLKGIKTYGWSRITDFTKNKVLGDLVSFVFEVDVELFEELSKILMSLENTLLIGRDWSFNDDVKFFNGIPKNFIVFEKWIKESDVEISYLIKCCESHYLINKYIVNSEFIVEFMILEVEIQKKFLLNIFHEKKRIFDLSFHLKKLKKELVESVDKGKKGFMANYMNLIKRIKVTPLTIFYYPPELDVGNRVIRRFREMESRFARVSFADEDFFEEKRIFSDRYLTDRVRNVITNGIRVGKFKFKLLSFSNSQLRSMSCWMYSRENEDCPSCTDIIETMGNFKSIKNIAKYAARIGLAFSTSKASVQIKESEFITIKDVENGKYVFTDGVGLIDKEFCNVISRKMNITKTVSAIQFRFAGYKGVMSVFDFKKFPEYKGKKLVFRESQRKFHSKNLGFDVVRVNDFWPGFLNRQIISILSSNGIKDEYFLSKQRMMLEDLDKLKDRNVVIKMLKNFKGENPVMNVLLHMLQSGFSLQERFIGDCIISISNLKRAELREKARIFVDDSAFLMGIADETNTLEYGEVFIQIQRDHEQTPEILEKKVVVCKNPCFAGGDVRVLQCRKVKDLNHLVNVIVFPVKGKRPHPNECSGSDLDGDIYFCGWDKGMIFDKVCEPMDFDTIAPKKVEIITEEQVRNFFLNYLKNDSLGKIANSHLSFYAFSKIGVYDENCVELARKHSIAVDFPKTGICAKIGKGLIPKRYPIFMDRDPNKSEKSECVLEKLFFDLKKFKVSREQKKKYRPDGDLIIEGYKRYIKNAVKIYNEYAQEIRRLLRHFHIPNESDLFTYNITKYMKKRLRLKQIKENMVFLRGKYRIIFEREVKGEEEKLKKASAWYMAIFKIKKNNVLSFPWVVSEYLCKIKQSQQT